MGTITLSARDTIVLRSLAANPKTGDDLAESVEYDQQRLRERLSAMEENGLLRRTAGERYALTESGRRTLEAPADGTADNRIDISSDVREAIEEHDLRPDREEAVINAVAFLQYWGSATKYELVDGIYSETPVGYDSAEQWWRQFARDALATLPVIDEPDQDETTWRYAGPAEREKRPRDGRLVQGRSAYGSVKHALETLDLTPEEREAVHAVFGFLFRHASADESEIRSDVYEREDAGYDSEAEWWRDCIEPALGKLPGITETAGGTWRYTGDEPDRTTSSENGQESRDGGVSDGDL